MDFSKYSKKFSNTFNFDGITVTYEGAPAIYFTNLQKMYYDQVYDWNDVDSESYTNDDYGHLKIKKSVPKVAGKEKFEEFLLSLAILSSKKFQEFFLTTESIKRNKNGSLKANRVPLVLYMSSTTADGVSYYEARYKVLKGNLIELQINRKDVNLFAIPTNNIKLYKDSLPVLYVPCETFNEEFRDYLD